MITELAAAKINLHLHVTGKRTDGYHLLDSLVCFADIGDRLTFSHSNDLSMEITGPFAHMLSGRDVDISPSSSNSVIRAAHILAQKCQRDLRVKITLEKNLPVGAGIGGGSADAAACLRGLSRLWNISVQETMMHDIAAKIGSDVPVCLYNQPVTMQGVGDIIITNMKLPVLHAVLIWPDQPVPTEQIFKNLRMESYSKSADIAGNYVDTASLVFVLNKTKNDLCEVATKLYPSISTAIEEMKAASGCIFTRMSGSGSTVFGIFSSQLDSKKACEEISARHKNWWVKSCLLNAPYY